MLPGTGFDRVNEQESRKRKIGKKTVDQAIIDSVERLFDLVCSSAKKKSSTIYRNTESPGDAQLTVYRMGGIEKKTS